MELPFIPKPNGTFSRQEGQFTLPVSYGLALGDFESSAAQAFLERVPGGSPASEGIIRLLRDPAMDEEGYVLSVTPQGVTVKAADPSGIIWGLTSLFHLLQDRKAPCVTLTDAPQYHHRGLLLDCARHFFPVEELLRILEQMGRIKMNRFHWHLTDDQGWRIESKLFPRLHQSINTANGETEPLYYTQEQIRRVVAFAQARGITVIPEVELPGHSATALAAYPQWTCDGKPAHVYAGTGISTQLYCTGKDETLADLKALLTEVAALFPGRYFHIGGDEAPKKAWRACPHCQARMKAEGLENEEALQGWLMNWAIGVLREIGKEVICWNDALKPGILDSQAKVQFWLLTGKKDYCTPALEAGNGFIFSEVFSNYFDYAPSMIPVWKTLAYQPHIGKKSFVGHPGVLGIESALWTEHISTCEKLEALLFPRLFATAEAGWTRQRSYPDFRPRLIRAIEQLEALGMTHTPLAEAELKGSARSRAIVASVGAMRQNTAPKDPAAQEGLSEVMGPENMRSMVFQLMKNCFRIWDLPLLLKMAFSGRGGKKA